MTDTRKEHGALAIDLSRARWRVSTRSGGNGDCVEVASLDGDIAVRDSKDREGPMLIYNCEAWRGFMRNLRASKCQLLS
jgi:hypothetical protein